MVDEDITVTIAINKHRCRWVNSDPIYIDYHDNEWGVPVYDAQILFEFLQLEGMQAGLSWYTILQKRAGIKKAFAGFNAKKIIKFTAADIAKLLENPGIIRNRLKINAVINNAQKFLDMENNGHSFSDFLWQHVNFKPIKNQRRDASDVLTFSDESIALSKSLKAHGFKFIGPTICYAFMQAVGMIDDHERGCFRAR